MPRKKSFDFSEKSKCAFFTRIRFIALCLVLIFVSTTNAEQLPIKKYTTADGLPRDKVTRIRQDSRGFLWFCTSEGISRFDGFEMKSFTIADGLPDRFAEDFLETKNGEIYIATGKGLARLNPHGLRNSAENPLFSVFSPEQQKTVRILRLYEDIENQVWVGTSDGLYRLTETDGQIGFANVPLGEPLKITGSINSFSNYVTAILRDKNGVLWVGTEGSGLYRIGANNESRRFTTANGLGDNHISELFEMRDGRLWASVRSGANAGICLLDSENAENPVKKCYAQKDGLPTNWITDILETSDGKFWLGTVSGLCSWQGDNAEKVCKMYSAKNGLCDSAFALAEDKNGNLWTGSECGAAKIARYGFTTYGAADGFDSANINSIFENAAGELLASTLGEKRAVSRFNGEFFTPAVLDSVDFAAYLGWGWHQTVLQDREKAWWIPNGNGLYRSPNNTDFENLARAPLEKLRTNSVGIEAFRVFEDSRGDIWLGTTGIKNELLRWERATGNWQNYTETIGLSPARIITAFAEDKNGNLWIGTGSDDTKEYQEGFLIRYRDGQFLKIFGTTADGAGKLPRGWMRDMFVDSKNRLWIASTEDGIWRLDETNGNDFKFIKYTTAEGLISNSTTAVTEDEYGRIYVGTWRGIDRITLETGQIEHFTTADGLPANYVFTAFRDRKNNLWFGTHQGLARFLPEPLHERKPPNILITGLRVEGIAQSVSILGETSIPNLELSSDQRQIAIDFLGLGASLGEKLKYEYRFGNTDWTATDERTVNFANLGAGDYRFEVRAQTDDKTYSQTPAIVSFRIAAPFWQRWWFLLSAAILLGFLVYLIYKSRLRRALELEKVRTRIATDLHDDIGANLTRISLLSEVAKQKSTNGNESLLTSIADIARESVSSMNDIVWAIAPEHDSLSDLTRRMRSFAEEIFALSDIDLEFKTDATDLKLSVGVRRDLLLIFKEAVNNAAKHSDCTRVQIYFGFENSRLLLQIKDNGKGFDTNEIYEGQGLRSIMRRADSLGGNLKIEAKDGTNIEFSMPLTNIAAV
ncbi:MAG TPA: two-component regulator propeller domain-containing protein [Pyrinomonadaceae bacterium]|nr:two-component regulator propeller domain-containing protein [Pyrinomonadaceae bacterium]